MIRFIDLGDQTGNIDHVAGEREFAFYDTVTGTFLSFASCQTWTSRSDFESDFLCERRVWSLERFVQLIPDDVR